MKADCSTEMTTFTGKYINIRDLQPSDISIYDIAAGLSNCCRFAGQCKQFYSVAQHSVYVAQAVWEKTSNLSLARIALIHDAPEAYLGDLVRAVKAGLREYQNLEFYVWTQVIIQFGMVNSLEENMDDPLDAGSYGQLPMAVKEADFRMLVTERHQLISEQSAVWDLEETYKPYPGLVIRKMDPASAKVFFLEAYERFFGIYSRHNFGLDDSRSGD